MKTIIIFLFSISVFGQVDNETKIFLSDILKYETYKYGEISIAKKLDPKMLEIGLTTLKEKRKYTRILKDSITEVIKLTRKERRKIIQSIREQYETEWEKEDFPENKLINYDELLSYLKKDRNNTIVMISKPVFIRNNEIAIAYFMNLCCGSINGRAQLLFFDKLNGKWRDWISIAGGVY
jgi:hypothetical protein